MTLDTYGETRQTSGSAALYNPFLYTGQEYDFETSLYHLRARHYSPARGRFFARDPIGYAGGSNMYAYCAGDPVNFIDPSGLEKYPVEFFVRTLGQYAASRKVANGARKYFNNLVYSTDWPTGYFDPSTRNIYLSPSLSDWGQAATFFHELLHGLLYTDGRNVLPPKLRELGATKGYNQRVIDHAWIFVEVGTLLEQMAPPNLNFNDEMAVGPASTGLELYRTGGWCAVLNYSNRTRQYK